MLRHLLDATTTKFHQHHNLAKIIHKALTEHGEDEVNKCLDDKYLPVIPTETHPDHLGEANEWLDRDIEVWEWKAAKTILVPKPGKPLNIENLRPIWLTSCVAKRWIMYSWQKYLEDSGLYPNTLIGFRNKLGAQDAMIQLKNEILDDTTNTKDKRAILGLDLQSAFDKLQLQVILPEFVYFAPAGGGTATVGTFFWVSSIDPLQKYAPRGRRRNYVRSRHVVGVPPAAAPVSALLTKESVASFKALTLQVCVMNIYLAMVHFCCVPECHQEGYRCKSGEKVSFHKFPRDKVMFKKWIIAIRRDPGPNFVVGQFTRVCSKHFKPDDYIPNVASGRRFLKDNAVPTQFVFAKPVKQRRPPKERALRCSKSLTSHLLQAASPDTDLSQRESTSDRDMTWEPSQQSEDAGQRAKGHATQNTAADLVCQSCTATFQKIQLELKARCEEVAQLSAHVQSLKRALGEARKLREDIVTVNDNNIELIAENKKLTEQLEHVKKQLQEMQRAAEDKESRAKKERKPFSLARFRDDDNSMQFYTGLSSYKHFQCFLLYLKPGENSCNVYLENESTPGDVKGRPRKLEPAEELFLTLMKLKTGFFHLHLGHIFRVSASTVSRVFSGWINFMYIQLGKLTLWVPRSKIDRHMPPAFRELYPSTRVIIDATEVKCEVPSSLVLQSVFMGNFQFRLAIFIKCNEEVF
ncbi:uncharacterized protein [Dermacentor albipictus]|uniref:uncharacterized protein n=1 Tax=Dermacentor albipictus TaxID=60249 RepID=UPI0038FD39DC